MKQSQTGVALIEVLVSILIFSFGVLGLIGLQARAISLSVDAEDRNRAAMLANELASTMWLNRSVSVPADVLEAWQTHVADSTSGGLPTGVGSVTAVAGSTNSADILITWNPPSRGGSEQSKLSTRIILP